MVCHVTHASSPLLLDSTCVRDWGEVRDSYFVGSIWNSLRTTLDKLEETLADNIEGFSLPNRVFGLHINVRYSVDGGLWN